jgi:hypothetical protein
MTPEVNILLPLLYESQVVATLKKLPFQGSY